MSNEVSEGVNTIGKQLKPTVRYATELGENCATCAMFDVITEDESRVVCNKHNIRWDLMWETYHSKPRPGASVCGDWGYGK